MQRLQILWVTCFLLAFAPPLHTAEIRRPNIILIMADDMGYAGPSCQPYGNLHYETPGIDQLAAEGLRFTDFHSSGTSCSPTRAGLVTGRYQQRAGIEAVIHPDLHHPQHRKGLQESEITFAELFRAAGYATGLIGKWHLGYAKETPKYQPMNHGFDHFVGYFSGNIDYFSHWGDHLEHDWWHGRRETNEEGYVTHLINQHALEFIQQNQNRPFCLYVAHAALHVPVQGPHDSVRRGPGAKPSTTPHDVARKQMMLELDKGVAQIREKVVELGLDQDTFLMFFSDNGHDPGTATGSPRYRGHKGSVYEGGTRVPAIAWWPKKIKPNTQTDALTISLDVMPTILSLAGIETPQKYPLDGIDLSPVLLAGTPLSNRTLFWANLLNLHACTGPRSEAVREGAWKLVVQHPGAQLGTFENEQVELYHLGQDPGETNNIASQHPQRAADMLKRLQAWYMNTQHTAAPQPDGWPLLRPLKRPGSPVRAFPEGFVIDKDEPMIVILGSTNAWESDRYGYSETLLTAAHSAHRLRFRNMSWQADTVYQQRRPRNFYASRKPPYGERDGRKKTTADIVFFWMGQAESLEGQKHLGKFTEAYSKHLAQLAAYTERVVLVTPVPFSDPLNLGLDLKKRNQSLAHYVDVIKQIGHARKLPVVDLFAAFQSSHRPKPFSQNGLNLSPAGHWFAAQAIARQLGFLDRVKSIHWHESDSTLQPTSIESLRQAICQKNDLWHRYWRPTNWAFLYGNRQHAFSSRDHNDRDIRWFPKEIQAALPQIEENEQQIQKAAANAVKEKQR